MSDGDVPRPSLLERAVDRIPFLEKELFLLRRMVAPGDVCIDVGAAGGAHLLVMARRVGPAGRVLGFEPRPGSHRFLERVVRLAGLGDRVSLHPLALADEPGSQPLRVPVVPTRAHFRGSTADPEGAAAFATLPHREIEVTTSTLDDEVVRHRLPHVDLIKCDVEGAELLVLAGAREVLAEHRPVVVLEADDLHQAREDARAQDVIDEMVGHGYRVYRYRRGALEEVTEPLPDEDDYVFVPQERTPRVRVRSVRMAA
jgi:FkbM family methyltransferase